MAIVTELQAKFDSSASFYNKANTLETPKFIKLKSFETIVAVINKETKTVKVNGYFSSTTARHINEFLSQNMYGRLTKTEMENKPTITLS